jgi:hypothetical protein
VIRCDAAFHAALQHLISLSLLRQCKSGAKPVQILSRILVFLRQCKSGAKPVQNLSRILVFLRQWKSGDSTSSFLSVAQKNFIQIFSLIRGTRRL